jgi:hypothetical protein
MPVIARHRNVHQIVRRVRNLLRTIVYFRPVGNKLPTLQRTGMDQSNRA